VSGTTTAGHLAGRSVRVDVPATSANLGAGFDALALALDFGAIIEVTALPAVGQRHDRVEVVGEGAGQVPTGRTNRCIVALHAGLTDGGVHVAGLGWRVRIENHIPVSRGLGSSASATIGALVAADALLDGTLGTQRILELAARLEGHADNAAAALHGGFCVVATVDGRPEVVRLDPPTGLLAALYIPDKHLSTAAMRTALPAAVPFADAVHNVGAAALTVAALSQGRLELLAAGTRDRLHEPYRAAAYRELPELIAAARGAGALGACLSGAGSTVIAFSDEPTTAAVIAAAMERRAQALGLTGKASVQAARAEGARVVATPPAPPTAASGGPGSSLP
jgi:homoserine kinase